MQNVIERLTRESARNVLADLENDTAFIVNAAGDEYHVDDDLEIAWNHVYDAKTKQFIVEINIVSNGKDTYETAGEFPPCP